MKITALFFAPLFLAAAALARGPADFVTPAKPKVKAEIIADSASVAAGKSFVVGVKLTTERDYHIYWTNPGEAGLPTRFTWKLPEGFKVEAMPFPLPHTFVQPGDIKGYGYTGEATFLFTVTPPEMLPAGPFAMQVIANWLCCDKEKCTPGNATVSVTLPKGDGAGLNKLAAARASLPSPVADAATPGAATTKVDGDDVIVTIPLAFKEPPKTVEIFPMAVEALEAKKAQASIDKRDVTISLSLHILGGQTLKTGQMPVLVVYTLADNARHGFFMNADLKGLGPPGP